MRLTWKRGQPAPHKFVLEWGTAVSEGNNVYLSCYEDIYLYQVHLSGKWQKLPSSNFRHFGMAIVDNNLVTIGGYGFSGVPSKAVVSLLPGRLFGKNWKELYPAMKAGHIRPASCTTSNCLVVAGGQKEVSNPFGMFFVEVLDLKTSQWSLAGSLPQSLSYPQMAFCEEHIYVCQDNTVFSCSFSELLKSCDQTDLSVWSRQADIPMPEKASIVNLQGQLLAIGGNRGYHRTGAIHQYDSATNSWNLIGQLPKPRSNALVALLPNNVVMVVGGWDANDRVILDTLNFCTSIFM